MKVKDYSYETFPRYTMEIEGALELKGNKENLRCRMYDIEYQPGCIIRFLFPNAQFKKIVALSNLIQRRYHNDIHNMLP